jgi:hypothetical protein
MTKLEELRSGYKALWDACAAIKAAHDAIEAAAEAAFAAYDAAYKAELKKTQKENSDDQARRAEG